MHKPGPVSYRFGNAALDVSSRTLHVNGQACPLEPKSFELLKFLVENRGRALAKDEIVAAIWPGTFVTDNSLARAVTKIRKALRDDSAAPQYIETIPKIGYRFIADCSVGQDPAAAREAFTSIAILPIANRTADAGSDYLAEGVTDGTIRLLSEIPKLKVIARATVYRFRPAHEDPLSFARGLGVDVVLSGELKCAGARIVLDAELTNVHEGTIILSRRYLTEASEWMDVQSDLALDIVRGLGLDVDRGQSDRLASRPTATPEAFRLFLEGEFFARRITPPSIQESIRRFEAALRLDDRFALAWTEMASAHVVLGLYFEDPRQHLPSAAEAARRALELDGALQSAHAVLGIFHLVYDFDYAAAEAELASVAHCRHAVLAFTCTGHLLEQTGRGRLAEDSVRNTLAFDPRNPTLIYELGCNDYYRRRYEDAIGYFRASLELDAQSPLPFWGIGRACGQLGRYGEALETLRSFKARMGFEPPILTGEIGYVLGAAGRREEAAALVRELEQAGRTHYVNPYLISIVYLGMGDLDQAFLWLEEAYATKSTFLISIAGEPKWQGVRDHPRFQQMLRRINL